MSLQDEIKLLKERIIELEVLAEEEQKFPLDWDEYWYIDINGDAVSEKWLGVDIEKDMFEIGNFFKTKEQAEFAVEKLKVEAELRKFSSPFKEGENNYNIFFEAYGKFVDIDCVLYRQMQGTIYFESREKAQEAIETIGEERIKKYLFEVGD